MLRVDSKNMIRNITDNDNYVCDHKQQQQQQQDIERSFSSQNIHHDIIHLMIGQVSNKSNNKILRMPTVEQELFEELLNSNKKPICICGRTLRPIKKKFVGLYCHSFRDINVYPSCCECNISFNCDDNDDNDEEILWLCPSKQLYPHLFGFFLCKTCIIEQMLSNKWTKQFSSTKKILNFILIELEKLKLKNKKHKTRNFSKLLKKMISSKDILSIDGKEKLITIKLMNERQKELANIFAKIYNLYDILSLLENICSDIVDFEFGYKFNDKFNDKLNDNMSYFEHIFKMTAWSEIRNKLHLTRIDWNLENLFWKNGLQKCLKKFCFCFCKKGDCFKPNDDEFECCWAKIEFCFMGSIRFGYLPLLLRYIYIIIIILIIYYSYNNNYNNNYKLYGYYIFIFISFFELFIINYTHFFITMFKLKILLKWRYKIIPKSILTSLIIDDLLWFNCPPLIIITKTTTMLYQTIGILRHLLILHSFKLIVMIITGLLQINNEKSNISYNILLSLILIILMIIYCIFLKYITNKYYLKNNLIYLPRAHYRIIYLGLFSLLIIVLLNILQKQIGNWYWFIFALYPFILFLTTTLAVSTSFLWIMICFTCHYNWMTQTIQYNKQIFWFITLIIGFFLIELETRRISRSLRWSDMKQNDSWVRGGCLTNCCLHFCCAGCNSS